MSEIKGKIKITVNARDQPGELIRILKPLSDQGANVHGVFHDHEHQVSEKGGSVPVEIIFTLDPMLNEKDKKDKIDGIRRALDVEKIEILSISMESIVKKHHVILIGHIFDTDVRDSIKQLNQTGAQVVDLKASIKGEESKSTVMFTITYEQDETLLKLAERIDAICKQKALKYITA